MGGIAWAVYFIDALGAPPRDEWNEYRGTVYQIMQQFNVPTGSRESVWNVLNDVEDCSWLGHEYCGDGAPRGGTNKLIVLRSCESQIVADCMEIGMGLTETTHMVNEYRSPTYKIHVGRSAVYSCYLRLNPVVTPLYRQKQGCADKDSDWAVARCGLAQQFATRLGIWKWDDSMGSLKPSYLDQDRLAALAVEQIVVWDETHKDARIGDFGANGRKQQIRFLRDAQGQLDDKGAIAEDKSYLNAKFTQQARFSFGCAVVVNEAGVREGRRCKAFTYSGKWIRTIDEIEGNNAPWVTGIRTQDHGTNSN
ncbi:hypothetical protein DYB37_012708 [Aphanomyces astaci]|uniref:Uncharacterized protein n=1 Tax=Aphanomyces astaci TaxID=112090 RepID=A0A3R7AFA3_APHAT|nr:hypothetical protein DYB35_010309 [Aphanomyces astaci]RHZ31544.1 hypothetical protein DYB37_012708 [Aphanomyces astaci]